MAVFTEVIKLDDQVSAPAKLSATEMSALAKATSSTQGALAQVSNATKPVGQAMGVVKKSTFDAANAMNVGKETISAAFQGIGNAAKSLAAGDVKGAVQGLTDSVASMAKLLDLAVPGLGEAAAAVIQIAGGLVGITAGLIKSGVEFAIASSQAKTQMLAMFDALGEGKISGEQVDDMLDGLSAKLGVTKDAMVPLVKQFAAMGVTSQAALEQMTTAALSAKALVGGAQAGADAFATLEKKIQTASAAGQGLKIPLKGLGSLADMGLTVDDVAKKMGVSSAKLAQELKAGTANAGKFGDALQKALIEKGAGPLEKMSLGAANLSDMFHQYIGDLFEDMSADVEPFMKAIKDLFGIFDSKSKPSGAALKAGIGAFFHQVFAALTKVVPMVKHFLLDIIIYGLKAYIAIKPIVAKVKEFAASATGAMILGKVMSSLWTVLKVVGVVILVVVAALAVLWAAMVAVSVVVWTVVGAILDFVAETSEALGKWIMGAVQAASDFIAGLVNGIKNGAAAVIAAVTGVVGGAIDAAKKKLGIASPSKVMMQIGGQTGEGFAGGLDDKASDVHGAASGLATAAVKGAQAPAPAASSGPSSGGGGTNVEINVQIDGAGKSAEQITEEMISQAWERVALAAGL